MANTPKFLQRAEAIKRLSELPMIAVEQAKVPPNAVALQVGEQLLSIFLEACIPPDAIVAEADGGVAFYFNHSTGRGRAVIDNEGEVVLSVTPKTWPTSNVCGKHIDISSLRHDQDSCSPEWLCYLPISCRKGSDS